jgi:hypothetical protein
MTCAAAHERWQADFKDMQYNDMDSWFKGRKPAILEMNPLVCTCTHDH